MYLKWKKKNNEISKIKKSQNQLEEGYMVFYKYFY